MNTRHQNNVVNFICSGIAGIITQVIYYPLSTLNGRIEDYKGKITYSSNFQKILFAESAEASVLQKISSLYQGFLITELHKISTRTFKYGFQPIAANKIEYYFQPKNTIFTEAIAGTITTLFQVALFYPLDTIKVKRQDANKTPVRQLIKSEGLKLYSAAELALVNKLIGSFVLFGVTAAMLRLLGVKNEKEATFLQLSIAAMVASSADAIFTNPFAVIKTRIQLLNANEKVSPISIFKRVITNEGIPALYKGARFGVITAIPKKAVPLVLTESLMRWWTPRSDKIEISADNPRLN